MGVFPSINNPMPGQRIAQPPSLLAPSRHLVLCTTQRCEPALPLSPVYYPFHASTGLYKICSLIKSVAGGWYRPGPHIGAFLVRQPSFMPLSGVMQQHYCLICGRSNGSGLNAEADEAMWGYYPLGFSGGVLTLYEPSLLLLLFIMRFITSLSDHLFRFSHYVKVR